MFAEFADGSSGPPPSEPSDGELLRTVGFKGRNMVFRLC